MTHIDEQGRPIAGSLWMNRWGEMYVVVDNDVMGQHDYEDQQEGLTYRRHGKAGKTYWRTLIGWMGRFVPDRVKEVRDDGPGS